MSQLLSQAFADVLQAPHRIPSSLGSGLYSASDLAHARGVIDGFTQFYNSGFVPRQHLYNQSSFCQGLALRDCFDSDSVNPQGASLGRYTRSDYALASAVRQYSINLFLGHHFTQADVVEAQNYYNSFSIDIATRRILCQDFLSCVEVGVGNSGNFLGRPDFPNADLSTDGTFVNLGWFDIGESYTYQVFVPWAASFNLTMNYANGSTGGQINVLFNGTNRTINTINTGDWSTYSNVSIFSNVALDRGLYVFVLSSNTNGSANIRHFDLTRV